MISEKKREYNRQYYAANRERMLADRKAYYDANREAAIASSIASRDKKRAHYYAMRRKRYAKQPEIELAGCARYREANRVAIRGKSRWWTLKHKYGITREQYEARMKAQNHCCACCGTPESEAKRWMVVDHCHQTKEIRGIVCESCNLGIGRLGDTAEGLWLAYRYLAQFETSKGKCA